MILAAHGSADTTAFSDVIERHAERIRAGGGFADVTAAYYRQPVFFRDALDQIRTQDVVILPVFAADGHYTRTVLRREMGLTGSVTRRGGVTVRVAAAVGTHAGWPARVAAQALDVSAALGWRRDETSLLIIGHGMTGHATSAGTVYALCDAVAGVGGFASVRAAFLDEAPRVERALARGHGVPGRHVVALPFLVADASHVCRDIPRRLGLTCGDGGGGRWRVGRVGGLDVALTGTLFADPAVTAMMMELACARRPGTVA